MIICLYYQIVFKKIKKINLKRFKKAFKNNKKIKKFKKHSQKFKKLNKNKPKMMKKLKK